MRGEFKKITLILVTFIVVFALHMLYFALTEGSCEGIAWHTKYIREQEYSLGISYALSLGFVIFAFLKFKENRKRAWKAALGGGIFAVILWFLCFLFGCCGSPMLIVYLNLLGIAGLRVPKLMILLVTIIFIALGYLWLIRKSSQNCCGGRPCKNDK